MVLTVNLMFHSMGMSSIDAITLLKNCQIRFLVFFFQAGIKDDELSSSPEPQIIPSHSKSSEYYSV